MVWEKFVLVLNHFVGYVGCTELLRSTHRFFFLNLSQVSLSICKVVKTKLAILISVMNYQRFNIKHCYTFSQSLFNK